MWVNYFLHGIPDRWRKSGQLANINRGVRMDGRSSAMQCRCRCCGFDGFGMAEMHVHVAALSVTRRGVEFTCDYPALMIEWRWWF